MKKTIFLTAVILLTTMASAEQLQLELENEDGQTVPAEYEVYQDGNLIESSSDSLNVTLTQDENYTVKQKAPTPEGWYNLTYYNLSVSQDVSPATQLINTTIPEDQTFLTDKSKTYAVQTSNFDYSRAQIRITSPEQPNRVGHCLSYDYQVSECTEWNINSTGDYSSSYSSEVIEFNVTDFDGYTTGATAPYPNIKEIRIYDVTDTMNNREEGTLLDQGLNSTFSVSQYSPGEYRFEFDVVNNGSEVWDLASADRIFETGLLTDWTVSDIFYELGQIYEQGTFSGGEVSWDTNEGELDTSGSNDTLEANFVLDLGLDQSVTTDNLFGVEDVSEETGTDEEHEIRWRKLGDLNVSIQKPPNGTVLSKGHNFTVNGSVECLDGFCGEVAVSPRYNTSEGYRKIPEGSGTPFYTEESNEKVCGTLSDSETCSVSWQVNATGDLKSWRRLDVNSSSNYSDILESSSSYTEVQINEMLIMDLSWDQTSFGYVNPGENNKPAERNGEEAYNISIGEESLKVDNLWVKGSGLISTVDPDYRIGITNLTMTTGLIDRNHTVRQDYTRLMENIDPGTTFSTRYWLDIPLGRTQGGYTGSLTFKANTTQ